MGSTENMPAPDHTNQRSTDSPTKEATNDVRPSSEKTTSNAGSVTAKEPDPETEYLEGTKLYLLFSSLLLTVLIMTIDTSVVSTAIPRITDQFHTIKDIGWYGAAYLFANSSFTPTSGKIYTFFPMKTSFICFLAIFELGSLLCATSVSSAMFIIGRAVAGLGASGLVNGALTIVGSCARPDKKPLLMSIIMAGAGSGQIIGPLIGGAITTETSWRWCFYINLPCGGLIILFLVFISFPNNLPKRKIDNVVKDFDLIGFAIFAPGVIMLMMALQWGGLTYPWNSATIISLLSTSGVMLIAFFFWERHAADNAMFQPRLFRVRAFTSACLTGWCAGGGLLIILYYLPLWFQTIRSKTPLGSAVSTLPSFVLSLLFAILEGILCPRIIPYLTAFAIIGSVFGALGTGMMAIFTPSTTAGLWIGLQILAGAGRGFIMQTPVQTVQLHISRSDMAVGTAVVSFFQFFGGAFMLAIAQTLFGNLLRNSLGRYVPGLDANAIIQNGATDLLRSVPAQDVALVKLAYNDAITKTFILSAAVSAVGVLSSFGMGWKKVPRKTEGKTNGKDGGETQVEKQKSQQNESEV